MANDNFKSYYKKSRDQRIDILLENEQISADQASLLKGGQGLSNETADNMVENALATYRVPYGLATSFLINDQEFQIPMVTEEPSVIAAASNGAKMASTGGGFWSKVNRRLMTGQIAFTNIGNDQDVNAFDLWVKDHHQELIQVANEAYPSIVKRGGGARDIKTQYFPATKTTRPFFNLYLTIDTKEAMGANMMNTILEALKGHILNRVDFLPNLQAIMAILSNYALDATATATCAIPAASFDKSGIDGRMVAEKIAIASELAQVDVYRATTHNKGIMNGVDAFVMATGNDWRAVEASIHAYASRDGQYRGLAKWRYDASAELLHGELTLPLALGSVGGSIGIHPTVQVTKSILGNPDAKDLMMLGVSLGLAQNLAALRALVTEGIQAGHMQLQARSLAIQAGASDSQIQAVVAALEAAPHMNLETAKAIVANLSE